MSPFSQLVHDFLETGWIQDPVAATRMGIHHYDHCWANRAPEAMQEWGQRLEEFRRRFEGIDQATLNHE